MKTRNYKLNRLWTNKAIAGLDVYRYADDGYDADLMIAEQTIENFDTDSYEAVYNRFVELDEKNDTAGLTKEEYKEIKELIDDFKIANEY